MKILIDMNLSPLWVDLLNKHGWEALHWSETGDPKASDEDILRWAVSHRYVVMTHDLDFGSIIAATNAEYPSVIQIRTLNVDPADLGNFMLSMLEQFRSQLEQGALIGVDKNKLRARILPLKREGS
jgi:predicted nuclease of predicted toxin-antitoxin system